MSNRTVLVDGNTNNNTHIATVGKAFASNETTAHKIATQLDASHILVLFGGAMQYTGDDIAKFQWMFRIASNAYPGEIDTNSFYKNGQYGPGKDQLGEGFKNSLMYRLAYYRFGEWHKYSDVPPGFDIARRTEIGFKNFKLHNFKEAYTTSNWLLRLYEVLPERNREPSFKNAPKRSHHKTPYPADA